MNKFHHIVKTTLFPDLGKDHKKKYDRRRTLLNISETFGIIDPWWQDITTFKFSCNLWPLQGTVVLFVLCIFSEPCTFRWQRRWPPFRPDPRWPRRVEVSVAQTYHVLHLKLIHCGAMSLKKVRATSEEFILWQSSIQIWNLTLSSITGSLTSVMMTTAISVQNAAKTAVAWRALQCWR